MRHSSRREYVGLTKVRDDESAADAVERRRRCHDISHEDYVESRGAAWLRCVKLHGSPVILGEFTELAGALMAELAGALWRLGRVGGPYADGRGGVGRGACFLRPRLMKQEVDLVKRLAAIMPRCAAMLSLIPARPLAADFALAAAALLPVVCAYADVARHLSELCYFCAAAAHYTKECPAEECAAAGGTATAVAAPARVPSPQTAKPQTAKRRDYHKHPAFSRAKCARCTRFSRRDQRCLTCKRKKRKKDLDYVKVYPTAKCAKCKSFNNQNRCTRCRRKRHRD